jgi:hypothetical protein
MPPPPVPYRRIPLAPGQPNEIFKSYSESYDADGLAGNKPNVASQQPPMYKPRLAKLKEGYLQYREFEDNRGEVATEEEMRKAIVSDLASPLPSMDAAHLAELKEQYRRYREYEDERAEAITEEEIKQAGATEAESVRSDAERSARLREFSIRFVRDWIAKRSSKLRESPSGPQQDHAGSTHGEGKGRVADLPLLTPQTAASAGCATGVIPPSVPVTPAPTDKPPSVAVPVASPSPAPQRAIQHRDPVGRATVITDWLSRLIDGLNRLQTMHKCHLTLDSTCSPQCSLHGSTEIRHGHFIVFLARPDPTVYPGVVNFDHAFLGVLELFSYEEGGQRTFDFAEPHGETDEDVQRLKEYIHAYKKSGRLASVYLPVRLFGASPLAGLNHERRQILGALTHETTRAKYSSREDKGGIITGGENASAWPHLSLCPYLESGERYVAFNGNGGFRRRHLRGCGYRLAGKTGRGWLWRAGFLIPDDERAKEDVVVRFLTELSALCGPFGLVAAGWHADKREWRSLREMLELTRKPAGRSWLERCSLRIYTREDYLVRWRRYFADRLGFSHIPGDRYECGSPPPLASAAVASAADLHLWMRQAGMTDRELAVRLGLSRSYVSRQRSGRVKWSRSFQAKVAKLVAEYEDGLPQEGPS